MQDFSSRSIMDRAIGCFFDTLLGYSDIVTVYPMGFLRVNPKPFAFFGVDVDDHSVLDLIDDLKLLAGTGSHTQRRSGDGPGIQNLLGRWGRLILLPELGDRGNQVFFRVRYFVSAEKVGARATLGAALAVFPFSCVQVVPVMIDDGVGIGGEVKLLAESSVHLDDRVFMGIGHAVFSLVEIAEVFDADPSAVGIFDSRRNSLQGPAKGNGTIREGREVLADITPPAIDRVIVFHPLQELKMIISIEIGVFRFPGVMILNPCDDAINMS